MRRLEVEFSQFYNRCQVIFLVLLEIPMCILISTRDVIVPLWMQRNVYDIPLVHIILFL